MLENLIKQWELDVSGFPGTEQGVAARAAVNCCRRELEEALKDIDGEMRVELKQLITDLNAESARKRIRVMQLCGDESPLTINKDPGSWNNGFHMGVDHAVKKLKAAVFFKIITGDEEEILTQ